MGLKWRRVGCAIKTTNGGCKFGRGFRIVRSAHGFELMGMGLHFGTQFSIKGAKSLAQQIFNDITISGRHPVGGQR